MSAQLKNRASRIVALAALLLAIAAASQPTASDASVRCRPIHGLGERFAVRILDGGITCRSARSALRRTIRTAEQRFNGWLCFFGHSQDPWAATCIRGRETTPRVVVRAY